MIKFIFWFFLREAAKNGLFLVVRPLRGGGGGGKGLATKKIPFFEALKKILALSSRGGGGGKALEAGSLKKTVLWLPLPWFFI